MDGSAASSLQIRCHTDKLDKALQLLQDGSEKSQAGELDTAVQLLGEALELHIDVYGGRVPAAGLASKATAVKAHLLKGWMGTDTSRECAKPYHLYGAALFSKAQEDSDVFGTCVPQQASSDMQADVDKGNRKDKEMVAEKEAFDDVHTKDEDSEADDDGNDMQLAWEMLELAKLCYSSDISRHKEELADVHILLGDIGMEQEAFDGALSDYSESIKLLPADQVIDRKMAELNYKMALAFQYLDEPEKALEHTNVAVAHSQASMMNAAEGASREDSKAAETNRLQAILTDLQAKADELRDAVHLRASIKNAMKGAFMQLAGGMNASAHDRPGPLSLQASDAPSSSLPRPADSAVQDLGFVGRGSKRIKLAPAPPTGSETSRGVSRSQISAPLLGKGEPHPNKLVTHLAAGTGLGTAAASTVPLASKVTVETTNSRSRAPLPPAIADCTTADKRVQAGAADTT